MTQSLQDYSNLENITDENELMKAFKENMSYNMNIILSIRKSLACPEWSLNSTLRLLPIGRFLTRSKWDILTGADGYAFYISMTWLAKTLFKDPLSLTVEQLKKAFFQPNKPLMAYESDVYICLGNNRLLSKYSMTHIMLVIPATMKFVKGKHGNLQEIIEKKIERKGEIEYMITNSKIQLDDYFEVVTRSAGKLADIWLSANIETFATNHFSCLKENNVCTFVENKRESYDEVFLFIGNDTVYLLYADQNGKKVKKNFRKFMSNKRKLKIEETDYTGLFESLVQSGVTDFFSKSVFKQKLKFPDMKQFYLRFLRALHYLSRPHDFRVHDKFVREITSVDRI